MIVRYGAASVFFIACLVMATGILLAAAGAHLLETSGAIEVWRTANMMQLIHGLGLLCLALFYGNAAPINRQRIRLRWGLSVGAMLIGLTCFCAHLYLKALQINILPGWVAPIGGMGFVVAWLVASSLAFGWSAKTE